MKAEDLVTLCRRIPFLKGCGAPNIPPLDGVRFVQSWDDAKSAFRDTGRDFLKVEAQGDLTGWLAKHAYDRYGGVWNQKAKEYSDMVEPIVRSVPLPSAIAGELEEEVRPYLRSLVVLYGMESFYAAFPKRPQFFRRTIAVLEAGRFPCGCVLPWPSNVILAF